MHKLSGSASPMSIEERMADYYGRRAAEYERIYEKPERQVELRVLREFVARALAGREVLEVACGTGYWTAVAARTASSIVATDINEEVLTIARSKPVGPARVVFRREDAYALPRSPERFTGALAMFWWSHIPLTRLRVFLMNLHSVIEPAARLVFIDNNYVEGSSTPVARRDTDGNSYQIRALDDGSTHEVLKNFPTAEGLRSAVQGIAADVRVESLNYYWILSYSTAG